MRYRISLPQKLIFLDNYFKNKKRVFSSWLFMQLTF